MFRYVNTLLNCFLGQHHRWVLWCPVFMAFGVGFYFTLQSEPPLFMGVFGVLLFLIGSVAVWRQIGLRLMVITMLCMVLGFSAASFRTELAYTPMLQRDIGPVLVTGTVHSLEDEERGHKVIFQDVVIEDMPDDQTPRYIRLKLAERFGAPIPGERIDILAVLLPPSPPVSPGSYDFQRHLYFQGIGATGYAVSDYTVLQPTSQASLLAHSEPVREAVKQRIYNVPASDKAQSILIALLTGERRQIPDQILEDIRKAGIAHLLAISGLHIGLVAGFAFFLIRALLAAISPIATRYPIKKISAVVSFCAILAYAWLVNFPIPAQRAVFMTGVVLFAILIDRIAISLRLAAFAACFILMVAPESLLTPSFQMSFAAVVSLIAFYEVFRDRFSGVMYGYIWWHKAFIYLLMTLITTVVASITTAPFALYHFQRVALLPGVWANMVAVPLTAFVIMPAGVIALVLMPLGLEGWFAEASLYTIDIVLDVAHWAAEMPNSVAAMARMPLIALIYMTIGGLWCAIWQSWLRVAGLPLIFLGMFYAAQPNLPDILVSAEGKQIAIHNGQGCLAFSDTRTERFVRQVWRDEFGCLETEFWPKNYGTLDDFNLRCDLWSCIYTAGTGHKIALTRNGMSLYQDCQIADIVIAPRVYALPKICQDITHIINRDIRSHGAHAITFDQKRQAYQIITTEEKRGQRPWNTPRYE